MYLLIVHLIFSISSRYISFIPSLLYHLLHHLQLTGVRCGSALKALKQWQDVNLNRLFDYNILKQSERVHHWCQSKEHTGDTVTFFFMAAHSAFCCCLLILILCFGLLLKLNHWHSVQVAVCPTVVHTALQQVLCRGQKWWLSLNL